MKKTLVASLGAVTLLACFICSAAAQSVGNERDIFRLEVSSSKPTYQLGEPVELNFKLVNTGKKDVFYHDCFNIGGGAFEALISEEPDNFLRLNANWGYLDMNCAPTFLKPGGSVETRTTILWNHKPVESNTIAPDVYTRLKATNIWNDFAFHHAGVHYLKIREGNLESEPIQITITQPLGEDLKVWNKVKDRSGFAYFMQYADIEIPGYKAQERSEFLKQVEALIKEYPNSFLTNLLRQSLDKLKAREAETQNR